MFMSTFRQRTVRSKSAAYLRVFVCVLAIGLVFSAGTIFAEGTLYNYTVPGDSRSTRMWVPDNVGTIKGILIAGNGAGADNRRAASQDYYQRFAKKFNFALVATSLWTNMDPVEVEDWEGNLAGLASLSNHPELVNAPWAPVGLSNGGQMSYGFNAVKPEKCLAFIANKGGVYNEFEPPAASLKTPGILIAGELDEQWRRDNIKSLFTINRPRGALWSWVEEENTAHAGMAERLVLPLMAKAIQLRYPQDQVPTATSGVTLKDLNPTDGYLVDLSSPMNRQTQIAPYAEYTSDPSVAGWLPNEGMADVFRAFATYDKVVSFTTSPDVLSSNTSPASLSLIVNTSAVNNWSKVELYDYEQCLKTILSTGTPTNYVSVNAMLDPGVHGLYVLVTGADGVTVNTSNAICYVAVPEPGTLVLLGFVAAAILIWLRRR
jgi:hypothetical protein